MLPRSVIRSAAKVLVDDRGEQGGRRADAGTGRRKYLKDKNSLWDESNIRKKGLVCQQKNHKMWGTFSPSG